MRAIILAGGYGTRLAPLTLRMPKALVPVAGESVLGHLLNQCAKAGVTHAVLSLNHHQKSVEAHFGRHAFGIELIYHYEVSQSDLDKPGAIGALDQVVSEFGPEESFLLGGDNVVFGLDFKKMLSFHREKKAPATLALYQLDNPKLASLYGVAQVDAQKRIIQFQEKPTVENACSTLASTAVYALSKDFLENHLLDYVENKRGPKDRIGDLWDFFVKQIPLYGFAFSGVWGDANSPESYVELHQKVMNLNPARFDVSKTAVISAKAHVVAPVIIGDGCHLDAGCVVGPETVLNSGCRVGKDACVESSILFQNVNVGPSSLISQSVLDQNVIVKDHARMGPFAVVGHDAVVESQSKLSAHSRVWPKKTVAAGQAVDGDLK